MTVGQQLRHLFVYGTLLPGQVRWHHLAAFVDDEGVADTVGGFLYDTGEGYPAFHRGSGAEPGVVRGRTFMLREASLGEALETLDAVEGAVRGLYQRVAVTTGTGVRAYVYEYGGGMDLVPIPAGDWLSW